ncbi:hypothetical protein Y032_0163g3499 [Ancylostoma ceylanicum]|uniref:Uncharacterized protein n=1 Tax=Ancylostoma ceylanicum TaxID=53326 RepID=A0A016SXS1_9BILA|nr:hypothetical protein Y032_0163g3499 [Ancylostoma ceylanicum]
MSQSESKNSLDRLYCPKGIFLPPSCYPSYVAMATLHNTLRLAEMAGNRVVEREYMYRRKRPPDPCGPQDYRGS